MNHRKRVLSLFSALGMLILIFDGKTALYGANSGIELCLKTVIPALFPFFVLSSALIRNASPGGKRVKSICTFFGLPKGIESMLLPCLLGGYPVGAQSTYQLYKCRHLTKSEAEKLLAFCNNAGPSFLFGIVGQMFPQKWMVWALWGIHIAGALVAAQFVVIPDSSDNSSKHMPFLSKSHMSDSIITMGIVCGWIILFRVLIAFLDRWVLWMFPQIIRVAFIGALELSNGCCELSRIAGVPVRFILCSIMLAAGGLCVTMQTTSVTQGLSLKYYWLGKLVQISVCLMLSFCLMYRTALPLVLLLPLFCHLKKKRNGNQVVTDV